MAPIRLGIWGGVVSYFSGDWIPSFPQKNTKTDFFGGGNEFLGPYIFAKSPRRIAAKNDDRHPQMGAVFFGSFLKVWTV